MQPATKFWLRNGNHVTDCFAGPLDCAHSGVDGGSRELAWLGHPVSVTRFAENGTTASRCREACSQQHFSPGVHRRVCEQLRRTEMSDDLFWPPLGDDDRPTDRLGPETRSTVPLPSDETAGA